MKQVNYLKRVQGLIVLLMLAFAAPILTACGNDDDEPEAPHPVVGVWKWVKYEEFFSGEFREHPFSVHYERYSQDGTWELATTPEMTLVSHRGTWRIKGDKMTQKYVYIPDGSSYEIDYTFTLSGNRLVIEWPSHNRYTMERIP